VHREPASAQIRIVDDVIVHERGRVDELHDRGIQDGPVALVPTQAGRHQEDGGSDALAAALLDVVADLRDEVNL
jgi:hypothetical protein